MRMRPFGAGGGPCRGGGRARSTGHEDDAAAKCLGAGSAAHGELFPGLAGTAPGTLPVEAAREPLPGLSDTAIDTGLSGHVTGHDLT